MPNIARRVNSPYAATRVTSAGTGRPSRAGPAAEAAGYRGAPMWPGISDWSHRCECSWAYRHETRRMEVKALSAACLVTGHRRAP